MLSVLRIRFNAAGTPLQRHSALCHGLFSPWLNEMLRQNRMALLFSFLHHTVEIVGCCIDSDVGKGTLFEMSCQSFRPGQLVHGQLSSGALDAKLYSNLTSSLTCAGRRG